MDAKKRGDATASALRQRLRPQSVAAILEDFDTAYTMARIKAAIERGLAEAPQTHSNQNERPTFPLDI
jgi:hypothetical protein